MEGLLRLCSGIDAVTEFIGRQVRWLILAAVVVSAVNAIMRKTFDTSSNAWLELQGYLFGACSCLRRPMCCKRTGTCASTPFPTTSQNAPATGSICSAMSSF